MLMSNIWEVIVIYHCVLFSLALLILLIVPYTFNWRTFYILKYMCYSQNLLKYMKPFFYPHGVHIRISVILALAVSLDTEANTSLNVLTFILIVIISMYFLLREIYWHLVLACLEMSFILNLMFMDYVNVQICESVKC